MQKNTFPGAIPHQARFYKLKKSDGTVVPNAYVVSFEDTTTTFDYNSYYLGIGATGSITDKLLYGVELVYEGGDNLEAAGDQSFTGHQAAQARQR